MSGDERLREIAEAANTQDYQRAVRKAGRRTRNGQHFETFDPPTVLALLDRLREAEAAVEHWKAHAEEVGEGFSRVCREHARSLARLTRIETLVIEWEDQGRTWPSGFDFRAALTFSQDADERAGASERGRG